MTLSSTIKCNSIFILGMLQVLVWGGSFFLMSIMADPIMRETGRASQWVYGALSLSILVSAMMTVLTSRLIARYGDRPILASSGLGVAIGLFSDGQLDLIADVSFVQPSGLDGVTPALHKIQEAILRPIQLSGHTLHVTGSMGLATHPADGSDTDTLLSNADAAMYRAKELGRNSYQFYTSEMNNKIQGKLAMQDGLRNALNNDDFLLLYQPQVDFQSGQ